MSVGAGGHISYRVLSGDSDDLDFINRELGVLKEAVAQGKVLGVSAVVSDIRGNLNMGGAGSSEGVTNSPARPRSPSTKAAARAKARASSGECEDEKHRSNR